MEVVIMTCYWQTEGTDGRHLTVWDHNGDKIAENVEFDGTIPPRGFPDVVLDELYQARQGSQPSAYNQELLFAIAAEQIEKGYPP